MVMPDLLSAAADPTAALRGWLTLVWALIVGSATLVGGYITIRTYQANAWDRKVSAARLVWSDITVQKRLRPGDVVPVASYSADHWCAWDSQVDERTRSPLDRIVTVDGYLVLATIYNNSPEPIGDVWVRGIASGLDLHPPPAHVNALSPAKQSSFLMVLKIDSSDSGVTWSRVHPVAEFSDSAGNRWRREGTRPPTSVVRPQTESGLRSRLRRALRWPRLGARRTIAPGAR